MTLQPYWSRPVITTVNAVCAIVLLIRLLSLLGWYSLPVLVADASDDGRNPGLVGQTGGAFESGDVIGDGLCLSKVCSVLGCRKIG